MTAQSEMPSSGGADSTGIPDRCAPELEMAEQLIARLLSAQAGESGATAVTAPVPAAAHTPARHNRASRHAVQKIADSVPYVVYIFDVVERRNIYCNRSVELLLGYTPEEIGSWGARMMAELIHPEDAARYAAEILPRYAHLQERELIDNEYRVRHRNGSWHWFVSREIAYRRSAEGTVTQILGMAEDVTLHHQAATQLAASERRFRALIENAQDGIALIDAAGRLLYSGPSVQHLLGYTEQDLASLELQHLLHPEDFDQAVARYAILASQPSQAVSGQVRIRHKNGTWRWLEVVGTNFFQDPDIAAVVVNFRDITERKLSDAQLRLQADLFANVSDAIIGLDIEQRVTAWNRAAERIYGWLAEEALGTHISKLMKTQYVGTDSQDALRLLMTTGQWRGEVNQQRKDGVRINVASAVSLIRSETGEIAGMVAVNSDITARKQAELALRESEQTLRTFLEALPEAAFLVDARQGTVLLANRTAAERLQTDLTHVVGAPIQRLVDLQGNAAGEHDFVPALHKGKSVQFGERIGERYYQHSLYPSLDPQGVLSRLAVLSIDTTDQEVAQQRLRASEQRLRILFEASPIGIVFSQGGVATTANHAFLTMFGCAEQDLQGRPLLAFFAPESQAELQRHIDALTQGGVQEHMFEAIGQGRDGTALPLLMSTSRLAK